MWKRCIAVFMVFVCLFCLSSPAFAVDGISFSEAIFEGLFWSTSRSVGIQGELIDVLQAQESRLNQVGLDNIFDNFLSWFTLEEAQYFWSSIQSDLRSLGTVQFSSRREVPQYGITITDSNNNDVRLWTKAVQDFWKETYNVETESEWITIDQLYGGYLSSAEGFVGKNFYQYYYNSSSSKGYNWITLGSYGDETDGWFSIGMDIYQRISGAIRPILHFDAENNTVTAVNTYKYSDRVYKEFQGGKFYYFYPVTISDTANVHLHFSYNGLSAVGGMTNVWDIIALMTETDFNNWADAVAAGTETNTASFFYNAPLYYHRSYGETDPYEGIVNAGNYMVVCMLSLGKTGQGSSWTTDQAYPVLNDIVVTVNNKGIYDKARTFGIPRRASWSVDITDSGTGTVTTVPDAVSTIYDDLLSVPIAGTVEPVLYFPSAIEYVPDLVDVLSSDYAVTGEVVHTVTPGTEWPEGVTIELTPPGEINIFSIWHYVRDSYNYVVDYLNDVIYILRVFPTPVTNIAWATVVVGIIFGLYRRFME